MQRYRWPGYEMRLLGELQKQQNNAQFCDILLETEGISVPTHSCILAALSPYLSEKLSASPSPSLGQKCRLQLQAVKAQTLLKLVGLLYSGELEVKGSVEQDDVLFAAHQFGIRELVKGWKDGGMMEGGEPWKTSCGCCRERNESRKMQDAQVQAEMSEKRAADCPLERRSCVSTGTQTVKAGEKTGGGSCTPTGQTKPTAKEPAPSVAQSMDSSVTLQPQNITLDKPFNSDFPPVSSGAPSNGELTLDRSTDSGTNPTSTTAWTSNETRVPISFNNDESNSLTLQEDSSYQQSSVSEDRSETELEDEKTNAKMADNRQNAEQPGLASRDEIAGEEKGNCTEKKHVHAKVGKKRLAKMKQMMETAQISVKVKLRRRTKGEVWEVVSVHDADETLSVRTSLKRTDPASDEPSSVQPGPIHKSETPILQTAASDSSEQPPQPSTPSDSQLLCSECLTPNQSDDLESVLLAPPPGPVEESDEQIEKLLEDIMMGLNILPNLERDCKKTHLQPNHDGALAVCQVPVTENKPVQSQVHAAASAAGCVHYQDLGTQIGDSSRDTAQNQPSCSSLTSVQSDAVKIQKQRSPQYDASVTSMGRREGTSHQGMPRSRNQNCPYPQTPTTRSVIPSAFNSSGQKIHYPGCRQLSSQSDQNILEFLPLSTGSVAQSPHSFFLPYMNELRLPRCLSPLEAFASAAKHDLILNNSTNHKGKIQPQPSLYGRPWLTENPGLLQFPLSTITHPEDTNYSCGSKRQMKHPELNPHDRHKITLAESCTAKKVEDQGTISAGQNAPEVKSNRRKLKKGLKSKEGDTNSDVAAPKRRKRKCRNHPQDAAGLLAYKDIKVSDGTKNQINLSICTVRLSSNNVLAKEREMSTSSSNLPNKCLEKTDEMSVITESQTEQTRESEDLKTDQTRIRTRGFLKKIQDTPVNSGQESSSVFKPVIRRTKIMNKERDPLPRRERGRPRKKKLEETPLTTSEKKSDGVEDEQKIDNSLPREEEEDEKTKRKCKRRRRDRSEVEVIQLEKTTSADRTGKVEANDNSDMIPAVRKLGTPKRSRMVTLKEFQKLIKRQHSKTRKSKESQDKETNGTARDGENEEKARGTRCEETDVEVIQPQSMDASKESGVISSVTVDQNYNQIFNKSTAEYRKSQQEDTNSSTSEESSLIVDVYHPGFSFDVLEQEVAKLAVEREQPLKDPYEAQKACDAGVSTTMQQTAVSDEGSSHSDTHMLPQEDKMPLEHNLNPQTPERTALPLSDGVSFIKSSGCAQEEEEEEEEVEVDVLLFSPDKVPQSRQCENGLDNMDISQEEEEGEDVNVIDVTGDEAE